MTMPDEEQLNLDFGDPELNDPNYEQNVGDDSVTTETTTTETETGNEGRDSEQPQDTQQTDKPASDADKPSDKGQRDKDGQQPANQQKADDKGNLVDAQGNIIAAAGAERRHYERVQQQAQYITRLERELKQAQETSSMAGALGGVPEKLGLDMRETELGLQVISSFKKDPVATARWALQETMRMGYNLNQIVGEDAQGQVNSGSLDLQAIKQMINEQVAPLIGDRQAAQRQQEAQQTAEREYQAFIAKHENADVHEDTIARMLESDPSATPETAYWQLQAYTARNGLDFTKPLRDQVMARQQGDKTSSNGHAPPKEAQTAIQPMPNGGSSMNMQTGPDMANPDDSWDSIVQNSLREAGFN